MQSFLLSQIHILRRFSFQFIIYLTSQREDSGLIFLMTTLLSFYLYIWSEGMFYSSYLTNIFPLNTLILPCSYIFLPFSTTHSWLHYHSRCLITKTCFPYGNKMYLCLVTLFYLKTMLLIALYNSYQQYLSLRLAHLRDSCYPRQWRVLVSPSARTYGLRHLLFYSCILCCSLAEQLQPCTSALCIIMPGWKIHTL